MKMLDKIGFTLIELIVVIANLGILMLILVPSFSGYIADAKEITCHSNRVNIERLYKDKKNHDSSIKLIDYLLSSDKGTNLSEFKCPSRGVYSVNESVDSLGTGETPDDSN